MEAFSQLSAVRPPYQKLETKIWKLSENRSVAFMVTVRNDTEQDSQRSKFSSQLWGCASLGNDLPLNIRELSTFSCFLRKFLRTVHSGYTQPTEHSVCHERMKFPSRRHPEGCMRTHIQWFFSCALFHSFFLPHFPMNFYFSISPHF